MTDISNQVGSLKPGNAKDALVKTKGIRQASSIIYSKEIESPEPHGSRLFQNQPFDLHLDNSKKNYFLKQDPQFGESDFYQDLTSQIHLKEYQDLEPSINFYSNLEPPKTKRPFKLFYKHLKRPHIKARMTKKLECNYVYHQLRTVPRCLLTRNLRLFQRAGDSRY